MTYPGPDVPLTWTFDSIFALGGAEAGEQSFFQLTPPAVDADSLGNLYILDAAAKRVAVFDGSGTLVRAMGRPGGGPGELQMPWAVAVAPEGRTGVIDLGKAAVVWFDPAGIPLDQTPIARSYFGGQVRVADGAMLLPVTRSTGTDPNDPTTNRMEIVRVSGQDTVPLFGIAKPAGRPVAFKSCGMTVSGMTPVFSPTLRWTAASDRLAVAAGAEYQVVLIDRTGARTIARRTLEPERATPEEAAREVGPIEFVAGGRRMQCDGAEAVEQAGFAERIPIIGGLAAGPRGTWWVRRRGESGIDVIGADGAYLGTLPASAPFPVVALPGDRIAAIVRDELDVDRLIVYRVGMPAR